MFFFNTGEPVPPEEAFKSNFPGYIRGKISKKFFNPGVG
jgi:hypothetical protein